jgi:hypothetical protein
MHYDGLVMDSATMENFWVRWTYVVMLLIMTKGPVESDSIRSPY